MKVCKFESVQECKNSIYYLLSVTCYMLLANKILLSETCAYLQKLFSFARCCTSCNFLVSWGEGGKGMVPAKQITTYKSFSFLISPNIHSKGYRQSIYKLVEFKRLCCISQYICFVFKILFSKQSLFLTRPIFVVLYSFVHLSIVLQAFYKFFFSCFIACSFLFVWMCSKEYLEEFHLLLSDFILPFFLVQYVCIPAL